MDREYAATAEPRARLDRLDRASGMSATAQGQPPAFLTELGHTQQQNIEELSETVKRLQRFADNLLGPEPQPPQENGNQVGIKPIGLVHELTSQAHRITGQLRECRRLLDRLTAL